MAYICSTFNEPPPQQQHHHQQQQKQQGAKPRPKVAPWLQKRPVPSLLQSCVDTIISSVIVPKSWSETSNESDLETCCEEDIILEVQKCWIGQLPSPLCGKILQDSKSWLDNQQGIQRLLLIFLCTIENTRSKSVTTPLYLYPWSQGRIRMLEGLLESSVLDYCQELGLKMYNFYQNPNNSPNWIYDMELELERERVQLEEREESLVLDLLTRTSFISSLTIHTVANDTMLQVISKTCHCLTTLDVNFALNVTDIGIESICRIEDSDLSDTLKIIFIDGTSVTKRGIMLLLENIRNLHQIESFLMEDFLHGMQDFFSKSELIETDCCTSPQLSYRLQKLSLCIRRCLEDSIPSILEIVTRIFPQLVDLKIHNVHPQEISTLNHISKLVKLKSLMVGDVILDHMLTVLSLIGQNLDTFQYLCYAGTSETINISSIADFCSNLNSLSISGSCLVSRKTFGNENLKFHNPIFHNLKDIHINVHAYIPIKIWTAILAQCTALKIIDFTSCEELNDQSISQLLQSNQNALTKVVRFTIRGAHRGDVALTESTVAALNNRCPALKCLGDCDTWSLKTHGDLDNVTRGIL